MGYHVQDDAPCCRCGRPTSNRNRETRWPQCIDCGVYFAAMMITLTRRYRWMGPAGQVKALEEFKLARVAESPYAPTVPRETE